jgi:small subunit ribosomal protein S15
MRLGHISICRTPTTGYPVPPIACKCTANCPKDGQLTQPALRRLYTPTPRLLSSLSHQDKSKPEQECTRLVLAREQKKSVIDQYQTHATDTGSPEVQIAIISERIGQLTDHFKTHQKDHGSRRGLLMLVSKRRRLLDYLKRYDSERYKTVIGKLGIRK